MSKLRDMHPLVSLSITVVVIIVNSVLTVGELKTDIALLNQRLAQDLRAIDSLGITDVELKSDIAEIKIRQAELDKRLAILEAKTL